MIEGARLSQVSGEVAIIAAWLVLSFFVALRLFRWR
jgi:hypothetical protein